jgi:hypothetical protein
MHHLFSPIQMAMLGNPDFINITPEIIQIMQDWKYMVKVMENTPTSVAQLVVEYPHFVGYSDSCGIGIGGVWTSGTAPIQPIFWNLEWPDL